MSLQELKSEIQELIDNDQYEEAHEGLELIVSRLGPQDAGNLFGWAILSDNIPIVELLLDNIIDPNIKLRGDKYPLDLAIRTNNFDMMRILLYHGADPNLSTFLNGAVEKSNIDMVDELLNYGADVNKKDLYELSLLFKLGSEPASNRITIAKKLIEAGADITLRDDRGDSLLHRYGSFNDYDMLELLLNYY